jgi:hypothetical protein
MSGILYWNGVTVPLLAVAADSFFVHMMVSSLSSYIQLKGSWMVLEPIQDVVSLFGLNLHSIFGNFIEFAN